MPPISPAPLLIYYVLYTTDAALAAAWLAANPSGVVSAGPQHLAASQGLTVNYTPTVQPDPSGCWFIVYPDGSNANIALLDKSVDGGFIDPNIFFSILSPPNTNWDLTEWKWQGSIFPYYVSPPASPGALLARRWACGFELGSAASANSANSHTSCSPAGSRTTDGYGFTQMPGGGGGDMTQWTTAPPGSGTLPFCSWERFYLRPWVRPNQGEVAVWSCKDNFEGTNAAYLTINPAGALVFRNVGNAGVPGTVLGTSAPLALTTWAKIDLIINWKVTGPPLVLGQVSLLINGVTAFSVAVPVGTGSGLGLNGGLHQNSTVGSAQTFAIGGLTPTQYKYDVDDWINVSLAAPTPPTSLDFVNGTHLRVLNPTGISAAGAWTGDYRGLAGNPPGAGTVNQMSASAAGTQLVVTTDFVNPPQLGLVSVLVQTWPKQWPASTPPKVGYRRNGGAIVQSTGTVAGAVSTFGGQLFTVAAGGPPLTDTTTIDLTIDKDAGGTTMILAALLGSVEYVGVWGPEDVDPTVTPTRPPAPRTGIHNAPYPEIAAVLSPQETMAWASARQGTYVGNGVGQDVSVGVPFQWLWVRAVSLNVTGYWWSSECAVHQNIGGIIAGPIDINFPLPYPASGANTSFHVSGAAANANQTGVVYQWVAFSDPDSRFCLNGAAAWDAATASAANALQDPAFTPVCVFTAREDLGSAITGFLYKGPGNPTDTANPLTGADVAAALTFATGTITTQPTAHYRAPQMAYSAWRKVDGTGASGMVDCVTYTGDGLSSRNVAVNLNNTSPLFAFGIAHTLASYFRDPSHSGLDSTQIGSGLVTAAIIGGGLNYVTVGALLNVAGRVYDLFVLAGSPYGGSWTPSTDGGVPVVPPGVPPITPPPGPPISDGPPPVVVPPHGWYLSDAGFRGNVTAIGDSRPANPRAWNDIVGFATGAAGMLGGSPGSATVFHNRLIYAASGYVVGTDAPPLRIFDGVYDRELVRIPPTSAGVARGIVALLTANGTVYLSTWDAGTTSATWTGRIFALDINAASLTPIGDAFPAGHLPYALAFHNSALWCGSHRGDTSAGKVFTLRPDLDTTWTVDRDLATDSMAGVASLASLQGTLYVGATAAAGTFAKLLARASAGSYSTAFTGTGGAATALNGFLALALFKNKLYASFWNADTPAIAAIYTSVDGVTWTAAYTGAAGTLRPFIGLVVDAGTLYAIGGGLGLTAAIVASDDGITWTNLTPQLPETDRTLTPAFGVVVN